MKIHLRSIWGNIKGTLKRYIKETELDQDLSSRLGFYFVCTKNSFPKCDHLQCEEFPSVFLFDLWIKCCSFLMKQNKQYIIPFLLYVFTSAWFSQIFSVNLLYIYFCYPQLVSCSYDRLLVLLLHYLISVWWCEKETRYWIFPRILIFIFQTSFNVWIPKVKENHYDVSGKSLNGGMTEDLAQAFLSVDNYSTKLFKILLSQLYRWNELAIRWSDLSKIIKETAF